MAERTAYIAEGVDYDYDLGGWVFTGTFDASLQTEADLLEEADGLDLEEAVAWGRARAARVLIRYGDSDYFSAGQEHVAGAPPWPPPDGPEFGRRRTSDEEWKDRADADPPIQWRVEARLEPTELGDERRPEDDQLVADAARNSGAVDWDGHLISERVRALEQAPGRGGYTVYGELPAYRIHYTAEASTAARAAETVAERLVVPAGWKVSISVEPA